MAVKDSIFGSKREERYFRSIEHTWGTDYAVYPQIPLSEILDADPEFLEDEKDFFYKTSVDYVLCSHGSRPILAIDFDGMGKWIRQRWRIHPNQNDASPTPKN